MADENDVEKPVYDSTDSIQKTRQNQVGSRGKADVFVSGESFGGKNPLNKLRQGGGPKRETIGETFLEDDNSSLDESGEIDPRMFA